MDSENPEPTQWRFYRFGLLVTGKGEEKFLPDFLRSLTETGNCTFQVLRRIQQRNPIGAKKELKMVGTNRRVTSRDESEIGLPARRFLNQKDTFVLLIDDLEHSRRDQHQAIFDRYRTALDTFLQPSNLHQRASVHFLVNMIEAYFFAHSAAINAVLGSHLNDHYGDVELIRHPKGKLKELTKESRPDKGYHEIDDGHEIVKELNLKHILADPRMCKSLRSLFRWCSRAIGQPDSDQFQLKYGQCCSVTGSQSNGSDS